MNSQPLVSIIIPTYNRAHLIGETLDSVLAQTYQNWECIIVDDGSTDQTDEVVGAYMGKDARFKYFHRPDEHLPGGNGARNYGFKMSKGEYIQWFDSDDLMIENKIYEQYRDIEKTDFLLQLCSGFKDYQGNLKPIKQNLNQNLFKQFALNNTEILTPTALFKRQFFYKNNLKFNEKITRGQESLFFFQVLKTIDYNRIHQSSKKLFIYKLHESSISGNDKTFSISNSKSKFYIFRSILEHNRKKLNDRDIEAKMSRKLLRIFLTSLFHKDNNSEYYYKFLKENLNYKTYKIRLVYFYYKTIGLSINKLRLIFNKYILTDY